MKKANFEHIEKAIGYSFHDKELVRQALSPPSAGLGHDNQRLEFLGDSILHLCATRLVYSIHEDWPEGSLTRLRGKLVSTKSLHSWALDLAIAHERGPRTFQKRAAPSKKELADSIEALLAAVLLDAEAQGLDGFMQAYKIVADRFSKAISATSQGDWEKDDPKSALQERAAAMGLGAPEYELLQKTGPEHAPLFFCRARVGASESGASGSTLKSAQFGAAMQLLEKLKAESIEA
jgi:ribonuclease-3